LLECVAAGGCTGGEIPQVAKWTAPLALGDQLANLFGDNALDVAEPKPHAELLADGLHRAQDLRGIYVQPEHRYSPPLRLVHEAVRRVETHRLLVEQCA
jgi:hypothetical protein